MRSIFRNREGRDLRELPLMERKRILRGIVPRSDSRLLHVSRAEGCGAIYSANCAGASWEGIIAEWKYGTYISGDRMSWVKIGNPAYAGIGRNPFLLPGA